MKRLAGMTVDEIHALSDQIEEELGYRYTTLKKCAACVAKAQDEMPNTTWMLCAIEYIQARNSPLEPTDFRLALTETIPRNLAPTLFISCGRLDRPCCKVRFFFFY